MAETVGFTIFAPQKKRYDEQNFYDDQAGCN